MTEKSFTDKFKKKESALDKVKKREKVTSFDSKACQKETTHTKGDKKNFMDHLINSRGDLCYKVVGRDITDRIAWYFVLVDKEKKEAFLKHKTGDSYNIEDYGKIIISGYGEEVPEDVQEMLKEKYGFENF